MALRFAGSGDIHSIMIRISCVPESTLRLAHWPPMFCIYLIFLICFRFLMALELHGPCNWYNLMIISCCQMLALDRLSGDPVEKHLNSWSYTPGGRASSSMLKSGSMDAFERFYLVVVIVCNRASPSSLIQFASFYNGIHLLSVSPLHSILQALLTAHFPRIPVLLAPYADFRSCLIAPSLVAHAHFPSF